jgi:uncharacterized NAD(P)/FAD-binding protein YdhS
MQVAIVGGGYSGTIGAAELALRGVDVVLVERGDRFAAGAAYGTRESAHLLNVRARNMSAFADAPGHFAAWAEEEGVLGAGPFVPRRDYHRYIAGILDEAVASGRVRLLKGEAVAAHEEVLALTDGTRLPFDALVLAGGNYPSRLPAMLRGPGAVDDPWGPGGAEALRALAGQGGDVLLLGTGLTMVDVALSLEQAGFAGRMVATSRRGLVPRGHEEPGAEPLPAPAPGSLGDLTKTLRAAARGGNWRAAVDSLRPISQTVWRGFSEAEKKRFLRHLRPWWDVHRHRIAPPVAARIESLVASERLEVVPGRIRTVDGGTVTIDRRGGGVAHRQIAGVVNCTGPEGRIERVDDPLIRQLLESGRARPDALRIGLDADDGSRVIGAGGAPDAHLYALGPLTRGTFWEIVAVPDIRGQARRVAEAIAAY